MREERGPRGRHLGLALLALALLTGAGCGGEADTTTVTVGAPKKPGPVAKNQAPVRMPSTVQKVRVPRTRPAECGDLVSSGAGTYKVEAARIDCAGARQI